MIEVGNIRTHTPDARPSCYVGRPTRNLAGSPLANPYRIGAYGQHRTAVIAHYAAWLDEQLAEAGSPQSLELARLRAIWLEHGDLVLLCWCAPLACHASVIKARMEAR